LTELHVHAKPQRMARKKEFTEQIRLPLPEGATARMDSVLEKDEPRLDMIRDAIEREIKRRKRAHQPKDD
jgi:hypothetical protein